MDTRGRYRPKTHDEQRDPRLHYPLEVMLMCVRWYVAYPLSPRHIEEMMHERGVFVDHTTIRMRSINRALFIDADEEHGLGYEVGSTMFQGSSAS